MGIILKLENFTKLLAELPVEAIILNDMPSITAKDREKINNLVTTVYNETDVFSNEPSCNCRAIKGGYNLGVYCTNCHSEVTEIFSQELLPKVWMRAPKHVAPLINPLVWNMLTKKFVKSGFSFVKWMCNTDYQPNNNAPLTEINLLIDAGVKRGYNNFVNKFDEYFDLLCKLPHFAKKGENLEFRDLLISQRDCVFSEYLPIPNKALLIQENTKVGSYVDPLAFTIIDAVKTIQSIDLPTVCITQRQRENRTIKTIEKFAEYYYETYDATLAKKPGHIRKHVFGTRCHFSARAVISSVTWPHKYDSLELPYGSGITLFGIHLKSRLLKMGYTPNQATSLLQEYTSKYNPMLHGIMTELIESNPEKGFACIFVRNPSLALGSTQRMFIRKVKKDPNDITIGLSILAVKSYNADFDGDQMSIMLMLDQEMSRATDAMAPHKSFLDPNNVRSVTAAASIPKPVGSTIGNWLVDNTTRIPTEEQIAFTNSLSELN